MMGEDKSVSTDFYLAAPFGAIIDFVDKEMQQTA